MKDTNPFAPSSRYFPICSSSIKALINQKTRLWQAGLELFKEEEMSPSFYKSVLFRPGPSEPADTIIQRWGIIEKALDSPTESAQEIIPLLGAGNLELRDSKFENRRKFVLYNILEFLNAKRHIIFDDFFDCFEARTLGLNSEHGRFELGFWGQTLIPLGLTLALIRADFEKEMDRATPCMENLLSVILRDKHWALILPEKSTPTRGGENPLTSP